VLVSIGAGCACGTCHSVSGVFCTVSPPTSLVRLSNPHGLLVFSLSTCLIKLAADKPDSLLRASKRSFCQDFTLSLLATSFSRRFGIV